MTGFFGELSDSPGTLWRPAIDVIRDDRNLVIRADVPGINPEEVKVEVEDGILTVSGDTRRRKRSRTRALRRERRYGSFSRSMALPAGVEAKKIKAETRDGIVEVTIPLPKEPEKKKIEIKTTAA